MKTTKTLLSALLPLLAMACGTASPSPSPPPTVAVDDSGVSQTAVDPKAPKAGPTKTVPPNVAALVATLVETGEVTSAGVGYGGTKSDSYAAYEAVVAIATIDELQGLLSHDSPIVRAYVGEHLAEHGGDLPALEAALADETPIEAQYGCMRMRVTVGSHVANALCYVRNYQADRSAEAERLLRSAAADPSSPAHRDASQCLSQPIPAPLTPSKP